MWGRTYEDGTGLRTDDLKTQGVCHAPTSCAGEVISAGRLVPNGPRETTDSLPPARAEDGLAYDTRRSR